MTITPHQILAELTELRDGIDSGKYARDEKIRAKSGILGNLVAMLEIERDNRELVGKIEVLRPSINSIIYKARLVHNDILERLEQSTH